MNIPQDASLDVKSFARDVIEEFRRMNDRYVSAGGTRITGAGDANTQLGLVTLRQLQASEARMVGLVSQIQQTIAELKAKNNLV